MLRANRVGQFVSVVLEYAVVLVLESKDRWVSYVMVVIMVNDQGCAVVVAFVLQRKRRGKARRGGVHHYQKCLVEWVSLCQLC